MIGSPEFIDKWTMFFGDLYRVNAQSSSVNRDFYGRDAFYLYLKDSITNNKPYDQIARELIAAAGDSFEHGEANWPVGNTVAMGPAQDTYDGQAVNLASMFLGINTVDCLRCHDGARHLDQVNLWGSAQTRRNMWGLSAYFARVRMQRQVVATMPRQIAKYVVSDAASGEYLLNTTSGNRQARRPIGGVSMVPPKNPFADGSGIQPGESRRQALARDITSDIQFSRAIVNYIWQNSDLPPVQWAMQFPDTREPRSNGSIAAFLNAFGRGDRDTTFRRSDGSILQALNMLNSSFVSTRIHQNNQGSHVATLLLQTADPGVIIYDLFATTLSRPPSDREMAMFLPMFQQQGNRMAAENLQWVLLNKMDFLFNY